MAGGLGSELLPGLAARQTGLSEWRMLAAMLCPSPASGPYLPGAVFVSRDLRCARSMSELAWSAGAAEWLNEQQEEAPLSERAKRVRQAIKGNRAAAARIQSRGPGPHRQATEPPEKDDGRMEQTEERIRRWYGDAAEDHHVKITRSKVKSHSPTCVD